MERIIYRKVISRKSEFVRRDKHFDLIFVAYLLVIMNKIGVWCAG